MERIENEEDIQLQKSDERIYNRQGIDNQTDIRVIVYVLLAR